MSIDKFLNLDFTPDESTKAEVEKLHKEGQSLAGINLKSAEMSQAKLVNADLSNSDLTRANFSGASMYGVNLDGSNLFKTNFEGANLNNATWIDGKKCVLGSIGKCKTELLRLFIFVGKLILGNLIVGFI